MNLRNAACAACMSLVAIAAPAADPVYRCEQGGKVTYSNEPCVGARVVDTTPTEGLDKSSGKSRKGADVQRAQTHREQAKALEPVFGETAHQRATRHKRAQLPKSAQAECAALDSAVGATASGPGEEQALYAKRARFRELRC